MLIGIVGEKRQVINALFSTAKTPALVIDCANAANPHRLRIPQESLTQYDVIPIELLYAFRDVTKKLPDDYESIIVTPIDILFNYHDTNENLHMYSQSWEYLRKHKGTVYVGVVKGSIHEKYAHMYCDEVRMGHTAYSQRVNLRILQQELRAYAKILSPDERAMFEKMLIYPLQHVGSITFANSMHAWAFHNLSVDMELYRKLQMLEELTERLDERLRIAERKLGLTDEDMAHRHLSQQEFDYPVAQTGLQKHSN